ncbi:DUF4274 domain-containing protein [Adhaeribacter pallidiroseus]|uniref:DUF4274 domain-containing protein n=1 Tax=Adhaeribacter pallidiroseus TaxID=2072847 RepID=A0A369QL28_9BACT|nr:DUF4274 domain-containing protein [Adhaeribacter pallidiroseus]RDC64355.1 hypothetical protein AHMF7616_02968 [Adhaeribacter pallidiroseus]
MITLSAKRKKFINDKVIDIYESLSEKQWQLIEENEEQEEVIMAELYRKNFQRLETPEELHYFMLHWNWDEGNHIPQQVVEHPLCDKGTALMVYWQLDPSFYTKYNSIEEAPNYVREDYNLLNSLEQRLLSNDFKTSKIKFIPSSIASWESREDSKIPSILKIASEGEEFEE